MKNKKTTLITVTSTELLEFILSNPDNYMEWMQEVILSREWPLYEVPVLEGI